MIDNVKTKDDMNKIFARNPDFILDDNLSAPIGKIILME